MKKILLFSALSIALTSVIFVGCKKDEETKPAPTITFTNNVSSSEINFATQPDPYTVTFIVTVAAEGEISTFTAKKKVSGTTTNITPAPADFSGKTSYTYNYSGSFTANDTYPVELIFSVTDKADQTTEKTFTVTKKALVAYGAISTYTAKLMGAQGSATGSFFATTNGNVYIQTDAKTNSGLIDFLYFYGATKSAALAAPDDADAGTIFNNGTTGLQTWATKNKTRFVTSTVTSSAFDTFSNDSAIVANVSAPVDTKEYSLATGNVIGFKTQAGKKGLIRVDAINSGASGDITITVKVQQ